MVATALPGDSDHTDLLQTTPSWEPVVENTQGSDAETFSKAYGDLQVGQLQTVFILSFLILQHSYTKSHPLRVNHPPRDNRAIRTGDNDRLTYSD